MPEEPGEPEENDWADRHVARWRDHWIDVSFDDDVEAVVTRIQRLHDYLKSTRRRAAAEVDLQEHEYATLHALMIRDTPGHASPSELAAQLGVSGAGMPGRLDSLERAGWIQRRASADDRRRIDVEVTRAGADLWRRAMSHRGRDEEDLLSTLTPDELATLKRLLKKLTLAQEDRQ
jgi:DNA-binding MarR family transcriptional regulator